MGQVTDDVCWGWWLLDSGRAVGGRESSGYLGRGPAAGGGHLPVAASHHQDDAGLRPPPLPHWMAPAGQRFSDPPHGKAICHPVVIEPYPPPSLPCLAVA